MSISGNFPSIRPSLSLDFANVGRLDPRVTFTRASTATYYDGVTTAKAEENLLIRSQEFGNTFWTSAANNISVTANTEVAPDGTTTAETLTDNATSGSHRLITSGASIPAIPGSTTFALSVFLKKGTHNYAYIGFRDGATSDRYIAAAFDLDLGTAGDTFNPGSGTLVGSTITSVGNGWYRCSVVGALSGTTNSNPNVVIGMATAATGISLGGFLSESYVGTGTTIYAWGAQLEQRSAVTAYTATTTQPITNYVPVLLAAQNNEARFDHNPTTGAALGLEIEEQRTNICLRSEDFSATWSATRLSSTNAAIIAPSGALTGIKLVPNTDNDTHRVVQTVTTSAGSWTVSAYFKAGEYSGVEFRIADGTSTVSNSGARTTIDLLTGTLSSTSFFGANATAGSATITPVGNGWYRVAVTVTVTSSASNLQAQIWVQSVAGTLSYAGNGYSGIFIWGAQLEEGAFATSYIPTTTATVTRAADAASMTGTNFSDWFNAAEGTVYFEAQTAQGSGSYPFSLFGSSTSNRIYANYTTSERIQSGIRVNGTFEVAETTPTSSAPLNTVGKGATAYKVNDFGFSWNGAAALTDTSTTLPIVQQLDIGNNGGLAGNWLNGTIRKIAYYPARLSNAQLQALTG